MIVRVPGHLLQPVLNAVYARNAVRPRPQPLEVCQALRKRRVRQHDGPERADGGLDRTLVVQAPGVLLLVDPRQQRVVLRQDPPQSHALDELGVGDVVDHLPCGPAGAGVEIEIVQGQGCDGLADRPRAIAVQVDEASALGRVDSRNPLRLVAASMPQLWPDCLQA